ncbi:hypothetical protein CALCODRAFT_508759 [Calocera cornea HHB12733]|uniref:Uncharacterized protein n=1 Tax=Calocera cornea HHB12733 TaxID=1353952 RepID=A0A165G3N4_9BASI|nr:hypothetical protein CALCODRAFT_508759 [Calocera cornea HHB12733]
MTCRRFMPPKNGMAQISFGADEGAPEEPEVGWEDRTSQHALEGPFLARISLSPAREEVLREASPVEDRARLRGRNTNGHRREDNMFSLYDLDNFGKRKKRRDDKDTGNIPKRPKMVSVADAFDAGSREGAQRGRRNLSNAELLGTDQSAVLPARCFEEDVETGEAHRPNTLETTRNDVTVGAEDNRAISDDKPGKDALRKTAYGRRIRMDSGGMTELGMPSHLWANKGHGRSNKTIVAPDTLLRHATAWGGVLGKAAAFQGASQTHRSIKQIMENEARKIEQQRRNVVLERLRVSATSGYAGENSREDGNVV